MRLTDLKPAARATLALVALFTGLSGCVLVAPPGVPPPVIEPELPPDPQPLPRPALDPPEPVAQPKPRTPPTPATPPEPETQPVKLDAPIRVAVLLSGRTKAYESVANAVATQLSTVDIYDLTDKSITPREIFEAIRSVNTDVVVAVGLHATSFAQTFEDTPVVFAQVFNLAQVDLSTPNLKGVSVLPPLDLQLAAWLEINPNLSSIGAIVGEGHERLIAEAATATDAHGVRFHHHVAQSDRETLYQFTRLVPDIDGFWLFPDNRVLSTSVLRQMLAYAARHRVQVAVFNDALLPLGATISVTTVEADIAETVISVAQKLVEGMGNDLPELSPLNEIRVRTADGAVELVAGDVLGAESEP